MTTTTRDVVLTRLVAMLAHAAGLDQVDLSPSTVAAVAAQDLFDGTAQIDGRLLDSLALTEVLVQAEEELDVTLFDDERADDARSLADLVDIMLATLPPCDAEAWIARAHGGPPPPAS